GARRPAGRAATAYPAPQRGPGRHDPESKPRGSRLRVSESAPPRRSGGVQGSKAMSKERDRHRARLRTSYADWLSRRGILEAYRVRPGDRRTTSPPAYRVSEVFPELAELSATAVRLHPRYGDEPPVDDSKLGGTFLWPADEPWPICPTHKIPFVTVLQLRADDFLEMPFPPKADLFQVLWCPREHSDVPECRKMPCPMYWADPRFYWRSTRDLGSPRLENLPPREAYYEYVPFPCRLLPERVIEYPSV